MGETAQGSPLQKLSNYEFTTTSENMISYERNESLYPAMNYTNENMSFNITDNRNESLCSNIIDISDVKRCNLSVYSFYPAGLLWFGAICCIIFTVIGATGNFVSILALWKSKKLRNATTAFIVNLCVADFLFCIFSIPVTGKIYIDRTWKSSSSLCKVFALVKLTNAIGSIFTVVAITMNRYILIAHPNLYPAFFRRRNTALMIGFLWIFPFAVLLIPFANIWGTIKYIPEVSDCGVTDLNGTSPRTLIIVGTTIVPSLLFIGCYLKIYFVVRKSESNVSRAEKGEVAQCTCTTSTRYLKWFRKNACDCNKTAAYVSFRDKKEFRLLRVVLVMFIFHVITLFPLTYVKLFRKEYDFPALYVLSYVLYFSCSIINPIIYIVMSEEYRRAYKELFGFRNFAVPGDE